MRKTITSPFFALAMVAALGMGLAGCGSGSSDDTAEMQVTEPEPTPTPEPKPTPEPVDVADLAYLDEDNTPKAGTLEIAAGTMETSGGVTYVCTEGGDDCTVTIAEDGTATATGGTVTTLLTADAMEQVMAAKDEKAEEIAEMTQMARDRAIGQGAALADGGTAGAAQTFTVTRGAGKSASITGATGYTPADEQPGMLGNFAGIARVNTSSAARTDHLVVYTDIAAPKLREFFNFDGDGDTPSAYEDGDSNGSITLIFPATGVTLAADQGWFNGGNVDSSIFPQKAATPVGGATPKKFSVNAEPNSDGDNTLVRLPGTFDGARGTYQCTPADASNGCTISVSSAGTYSRVAAGDTWIFTPNEGAKAYHEDAEHVNFGWWMRVPTKATGTYQFDTHYGGSSAYVAPTAGDGVAAGVAGDATYSGNAAGRYVVADDTGEFTADAKLTAKFGGATATTVGSFVGSISGSITNFQGAADGMSGWSVDLKKINMTDLTATPAFTSSVSDTSLPTYNGTVATLGDVTAYGTWQGAFFGNVKNPAGIADRNKDDAAPLAVGGEFHADGAGAHIAGAFGARRPQ